MKTIRLTASLLILATAGMAQRDEETHGRPLITDSTNIYVNLLEEDASAAVDVCLSCTYHWLKGGTVKHTRGGYDGRRLHGLYTEFYRTGNLKEKGTFNKGLKKGEWRSWHPNGEPHVISCYRKGELHGDRTWYASDGRIEKVLHYKNGLQHGLQRIYNDSSFTEEKYVQGKLKRARAEKKQPEKASRKKKTEKESKATEETPSDKSAPPEPAPAPEEGTKTKTKTRPVKKKPAATTDNR